MSLTGSLSPVGYYVVMKHLLEIILTQFVKYAFCIGLGLGVFCMLLSYTLGTNSRIGSLLINLAGDFFMTGLTISVVDKLIKRSERQKFGGVPNAAKKAINNQVWILVGVMSYNVKDTLTKTTHEIVDSGLVDEAYEDNDPVNTMQVMNLAKLKVIDDSKLTLGMFSEMLRFIQQTLGDLDSLLARYSIVLDSEDISKAIALRDELDGLGSVHGLVTLTVQFFGQQTPDKPLDSRQRSTFMSINDSIVGLTDKLLK
jgi:hypothetical protein